jgi:hypothetical protein
VLGPPQLGQAVGAAGQVAGDAAPVDDGGRGRALDARPPLDAVPGVADNLGHHGADVGQRAQRAVRELVAVGAGGDDLVDQRDGQQRLVAARDADGDGLGLVLDGVDGTGQLLDGPRECGGQVVDHHRGRAHLALVDLVRVERHDAERVAEQRGQPHGGGRLELAVVAAHAQAVEVAAGDGLEVGAQAPQQGVAVARDQVVAAPVAVARHQRLDGRPALAQGAGQSVDGQRRLVAEQVPRHRRQHEGQRRVGARYGQHVQRGGEARLAVGGDDHGRRLVRPVDRHLLGDVVGGRPLEPGGAHHDERLRRQVDVLLVLGRVAGDRLVAELGQLDAHLGRGDAVDAVADHRPVALGRGELVGRLGDGGAPLEHARHGARQVA